MNSSTSSFKHTEWKVLAVVAIAFLAFETVARRFAPVLDYDREHIHAFPEVVEEMSRDERPRILILGNSLLMHGVDSALFEKELAQATSASCSVTKITPVGTAIRDWNYLYDTYFTERDTHPDVVVVGFVAHHVPDQYELKMRRLARHFCSLNNLRDCLREEGQSFDMQALGLFSHFSALYGDQPEWQWIVSPAVIPEFGRSVRKINGLLDIEAERAAALNATPAPRTYRRLSRLMETFRAHGVKAYFVPMPQPEIWDFDPKAAEAIASRGATLIDARAIPGMTQSAFPAGYHHGDTGSIRFTSFLARALADDFPPSGHSP